MPSKFLAAVFLLIVSTCGCIRRTDSTAASAAVTATPISAQSNLDRLIESGDFASADKILSRQLVSSPQNQKLVLKAAQIKAALGQHKIALDLARSVQISDQEVGFAAAEFAYHQAIECKDESIAFQLLVTLADHESTGGNWREACWKQCNREGRRATATRCAISLCKSGHATLEMLVSLLRRSEPFPRQLDSGEEATDFFADGLGMARWHFANEEFLAAKSSLENTPVDDMDAETLAFYGRLLSELHANDDLVSWHAQVTDAAKSFPDYWAAIGFHFQNENLNESSAAAFLHCLELDPTDGTACQRLVQALEILGRDVDARVILEHGKSLKQINALTAEHRLDQQRCAELSHLLLSLSRPFESFAWRELASTDDPRQMEIIRRRRKGLSRQALPSLDGYVLGVKLARYDLQRGMQLFSKNSTDHANTSQATDVLATPQLKNVATEVGADFQWYHDSEIDLSSIPISESVGGGIGILDYDLDGWPDVYFAQGGSHAPKFDSKLSDILKRNTGGQFQSVTSSASIDQRSYASGIATGDVNQDGFVDVFVGCLGKNHLLINNGDGTFRDAPELLGACEPQFTTSVAIADINGDAIPDLFEANYIEMEGAFATPKRLENGEEELPSPLAHAAASDRWFKADGQGNFTEQRISTKLASPATSLGVVICDFDHQGGNEIFVGNDVRPNHYLSWDGTELQNAAVACGNANAVSGSSTGCMGIAAGDFDRNGRMDLHVTNYWKEAANHYLQDANGSFRDAVNRFGLDEYGEHMVGFGTKAIDIDRNGWLDLLVSNGHIFDLTKRGQPFRMPPQCLMGLGYTYRQSSVDDSNGYWNQKYLGRSMATIDFDRNGSIDFLVGHLDAPTALLSNQTETPGSWIQFELIGTASERDAIGSRVTVTCQNQVFTQWITAGDGYFSSDEPVLDIGLGKVTGKAKVQVTWASGKQQTFRNVDLGERYLITENEPDLLKRSDAVSAR